MTDPGSTTGGMDIGVLDLDALVREQRVIVCCGSGGVGKTTSAAALGVLAAKAGRNALVMTIDPAKRLAQAMGLDGLDNDPQLVALEAPGKLSAMMLDTKLTFDRMVEMYAPSQQVRETIFANQYYQQLSTTLGGSRELIAMERVLEILTAGDYDLLIVDTPPAQHALDFLDAPKRLIDLLDGSFTQALLAPYGVAARTQFNFFRQSSAMTLKFLERLSGFEMLADLSNFLLAFSSMFDGLKERSRKVLSLMSEPATAFLLVCTPDTVSLRQASQFADRLSRESMFIAGLLVNRAHLPVGDAELTAVEQAHLDTLTSEREEEHEEEREEPLSVRVRAALLDARRLAQHDEQALAEVATFEKPRRLIPHFNRDLHSIEDLHAFAAQLR